MAGITPAQRRLGHNAFLMHTDQWNAFTAAAEMALQDTMQDARISDEQYIPALHATAIRCFRDFFPHTQPQHSAIDPTTIKHVMSKWFHRKQLMKTCHASARHLFQFWFHMTQFQRLNRESKRLARIVRQLKFQEIVNSAQEAARRHDSHALFSIINKYSPKQSKRRMQLRNADGQIASPVEEAALLRRFVMDTWDGPPNFPVQSHCFPGMPSPCKSSSRN